MQGKSIHIVFEVINFLLSDEAKKHKLFPIDKLILITLASHKGTKGIFPMQETLADELGIGRRYLRLRIRFLEKSGFLFVEKIGRRHFDHLLNLSTTGEPQIPYHQKIEEPQFRSQGNYSSAHRGTTDATDNKVSNKLNQSERSTRKKTALPLSVDFEPNRETVQEAKRVGLTTTRPITRSRSSSTTTSRTGRKRLTGSLFFKTGLFEQGTTSARMGLSR